MKSHCVIAHHREDESLARKVQRWILSRSTADITWSCSRHVYCRPDGHFKPGDITGHFQRGLDTGVVLFVPTLHRDCIANLANRLEGRSSPNPPCLRHHLLGCQFRRENYAKIVMELEGIGF